jgi:hypothetical protein
MARHYYFILRSVLHDQPYLRHYLTRCIHCHIFFITHPCNANRTDLGCPFGCSEKHRKDESTKRSTAYYQTPEGKEKKKQLNAKARNKANQTTDEQEEPASQNKNISEEPLTPDEDKTINPDKKMLHYLQCLFNLIDQQFLSYQQILTLLNRKIRQHHLRKRKEIEYVIDYCCNKPP